MFSQGTAWRNHNKLGVWKVLEKYQLKWPKSRDCVLIHLVPFSVLHSTWHLVESRDVEWRSHLLSIQGKEMLRPSLREFQYARYSQMSLLIYWLHQEWVKWHMTGNLEKRNNARSLQLLPFFLLWGHCPQEAGIHPPRHAVSLTMGFS